LIELSSEEVIKNQGNAVEEFLIRTGIRVPDAAAVSSLESLLNSFSAAPAGQDKSQARLFMVGVLSSTWNDFRRDAPPAGRPESITSRSTYGILLLKK
jgi:hypothetical protein